MKPCIMSELGLSEIRPAVRFLYSTRGWPTVDSLVLLAGTSVSLGLLVTPYCNFGPREPNYKARSGRDTRTPPIT